MSLTPNDIIEHEFNLKIRGYDRDEVDRFLEEAAGSLASVIRERNTLRDQNLSYKNKINDLLEKQHNVTEAITAVHKMAEDMKSRASNEADVIIKKARVEAERIVADAHKEAMNLEERVMKLRRMQREAILKIRTTIQGYLDMLDDAELNLPTEEFSNVMHSTAKEARNINREFGFEDSYKTSLEDQDFSTETEKTKNVIESDLLSATKDAVKKPDSVPESVEDIYLSEKTEPSITDESSIDENFDEDADQKGPSLGFKPEKLMP